jgi:hypothetical protein
MLQAYVTGAPQVIDPRAAHQDPPHLASSLQLLRVQSAACYDCIESQSRYREDSRTLFIRKLVGVGGCSYRVLAFGPTQKGGLQDDWKKVSLVWTEDKSHESRKSRPCLYMSCQTIHANMLSPCRDSMDFEPIARNASSFSLVSPRLSSTSSPIYSHSSSLSYFSITVSCSASNDAIADWHLSAVLSSAYSEYGGRAGSLERLRHVPVTQEKGR